MRIGAVITAEQWVSKMSGSAEDETVEVEPEGRQSGLGLGAKVPRQSKVGPSNDPVERRLYAKLEAGKRKASKNRELTTPSDRDGVDDSGDDEDLESRSSAFSKKKAAPPTSQLHAKKKQK
ncbi:hypothetical protein PTKIN_Ptkin09bG0233800 [Pterospermum kingtungense]